MEPVAVKLTARNKVRSEKEIVPNPNDVPPNIMAIPAQPEDHLTVERERWKIHDDSNHRNNSLFGFVLLVWIQTHTNTEKIWNEGK